MTLWDRVKQQHAADRVLEDVIVGLGLLLYFILLWEL